MTWEQKFAAILALAPDACLRMRCSGDWYVSNGHIEIKDGCGLVSPTERGRTPEDAVEQHWGRLTNLPSDQCLVLDAYNDKRRQVRWNGFMWADYK